MRVASLFAGIGGFDLAFTRQGHEVVYANEWDKFAAQIYEYNFKHKPDTTDIRDVDAASIPDHDILVGGFPCQSFSVAGKRRGFEDTRGTLFYEIARIARHKRPTHLLLENVKGLLSHDNGETFKTIMWALDELGYDTQWQVLNSKNFGVPQNRERIFIVGHLRGNSRPKVFPFSGQTETNLGESQSFIDLQLAGAKVTKVSRTIQARYHKGYSARSGETSGVIEHQVAPTLRASQYKSGDNQTLVGTWRTHKDGQGFREIKQGISPTIPARAREDGSGQPVVAVPLRFLQRNQKNFQGEYSFTVDTSNTGGVMVQRPRGNNKGGLHENAPTLSSNSWQQNNLLARDMAVRRLTPKECERLQGFPDNWTQQGIMGGGIVTVSDTQRYKCLGNAVTVNVVEEIAKLLKSL